MTASGGGPAARVHTPPTARLPEGYPADGERCGCGCELTPSTSEGFGVAVFARDVLGEPLDDWQRWTAIHGLELLPDGRPRFRRLLLIVARQNGKSHLLRVMILYKLFVSRVDLVLGTSTKLEHAVTLWEQTVRLVQRHRLLSPEITKPRFGNGAQRLQLRTGGVYRPAAANDNAGRGDSLDFAVLDELRSHLNWDCYAAVTNAIKARPKAQVFMITNQGGPDSEVLHTLRRQALDAIAGAPGDDRLGLIEYSADPALPVDSPEAILAANPNAEVSPSAPHKLDVAELQAEARGALRSGGGVLVKFKIESLCVPVSSSDSVIDPAAWTSCGPAPDWGSWRLSEHRDRVAWALDVAPPSAPGGASVVLAAAAVDPDGRAVTEVLGEWAGVAEALADLPGLLRDRRPRALGFLPGGPAAALAARLEAVMRRFPGTRLEPIAAELPAVCMGFVAAVDDGLVRHYGDGEDLLSVQAISAVKLRRGPDRYVFGRNGAVGVDALYAAAAAVHLAQGLQRSAGAFTLRTAEDVASA